MMPPHRALWLSELWIASQKDLPPDCHAELNSHQPGKSVRISIWYRLAEFNKKYLVVQFDIGEDDKIRVLLDRREKVIELTKDTAGLEKERRFISAANMILPYTPWWYVPQAKQTKRFMDIRGVDAFVYVNICTDKPLKVGVQIKSSKLALDHYFETYPEFVGKIVGIVVNDHRNDHEIRHSLYRELTPIYQERRISKERFTDFFASIAAR